MPIPKRWFQVSQDINHDPEVWSLTEEFGDRSLRTWMQILVYLDRSANEWRVSSDWLGTLARIVRQSKAKVSRQIHWMTAKGWLRVRETAADDSPLVYEAPNWAKYNKRRESQGIQSIPGRGTEDEPLLTDPNPSLPKPTHKKEIAISAVPSPADPDRRIVQLADDEFIAQFKSNPAYCHIDIEAELGKLEMWLRTPNGSGKRRTKRRVYNWMTKAAETQRE